MTDFKMREEFERTNNRDHRRLPPKGNNYTDPMAQADWESFQKGWGQARGLLILDQRTIKDIQQALREAADVIDKFEMITNKLGTLTPNTFRYPMIDELCGLAFMLDQAVLVKGGC